jgi:Fic family protein
VELGRRGAVGRRAATVRERASSVRPDRRARRWAAFTVTPDLVCELHGIATAGDPDPRKPPGRVRREDVVIGRVVVLFAPPPWQEVPGLLEDACRQIESKRAAGTIHAAAYALWRLNWIHPFGDGNGKTSRTVMYLLLCAGFGRMLPGDTALPDLIARNPYRYVDALVAADKAWTAGTTT